MRAGSAGQYDFYPRPPGGGRLDEISVECARCDISIHALRVEGDQRSLYHVDEAIISIHALRVEGDSITTPDGVVIFISIHALRVEGDLCFLGCHQPFRVISIHALRVEGDCPKQHGADFSRISIHALRVEGDRRSRRESGRAENFYPRPPGGGRPFQRL